MKERIIFEGKYLNGKRNGKGKEYDENGKLIFEGKYFDGRIRQEYYINKLFKVNI